MTVKKCDICGNEWPLDECYDRFLNLQESKIGTARGKQVDICEDCFDIILGFLNKKEDNILQNRLYELLRNLKGEKK